MYLAIKKHNPIVTIAVPVKNRLNSIHYFVKEFLTNKNFNKWNWKIIRYWLSGLYQYLQNMSFTTIFLVNDTTLASGNPLRYIAVFLEKI